MIYPLTLPARADELCVRSSGMAQEARCMSIEAAPGGPTASAVAATGLSTAGETSAPRVPMAPVRILDLGRFAVVSSAVTLPCREAISPPWSAG